MPRAATTTHHHASAQSAATGLADGDRGSPSRNTMLHAALKQARLGTHLVVLQGLICRPAVQERLAPQEEQIRVLAVFGQQRPVQSPSHTPPRNPQHNLQILVESSTPTQSNCLYYCHGNEISTCGKHWPVSSGLSSNNKRKGQASNHTPTVFETLKMPTTKVEHIPANAGRIVIFFASCVQTYE